MIILITILIAVSIGIIFVNRSTECQDIIGDGYGMGTDPEPVVIENTCDH
jgi:hypothetical protein